SPSRSSEPEPRSPPPTACWWTSVLRPAKSPPCCPSQERGRQGQVSRCCRKRTGSECIVGRSWACSTRRARTWLRAARGKCAATHRPARFSRPSRRRSRKGGAAGAWQNFSRPRRGRQVTLPPMGCPTAHFPRIHSAEQRRVSSFLQRKEQDHESRRQVDPARAGGERSGGTLYDAGRLRNRQQHVRQRHGK